MTRVIAGSLFACAVVVGRASEGAPPKVPKPPDAPAPGAKPLSETLAGEAKADYESAKQLYGVQDYATAKVKYQAAYDKSKDPRLLWNMAACERQLKRYVKARALVRRYLDEGGALLGPEDRKEGEEFLKATESLVAVVRIKVDRDGASIFVDDELVGTSPLAGPVQLDIGMRKIQVKKEGFKEHAVSTAIGTEPNQTIDVKLTAEAHEGTLAVHAPPGASIAIDGKEVGVETWSGKLKSGGHSIRVSAKGMRTHQTEITLLDGESRSIDVALEAAPVPVAPPPPEESSPIVTFGARGTIGIMLRNDQPGMLGAEVEAGLHVMRWLVIAPYLHLGSIARSSGCGFGLATEANGGPQYAFDRCGFMKPGLAVIVHLRQRASVDPWVSLDFGVMLVGYDWRRVDAAAPSKSPTSVTDAYSMAGLGVGLDLRPFSGLQSFAFGPFLAFSYAFATGDGVESFDTATAGTKKPKTVTSGVRVALTL